MQKVQTQMKCRIIRHFIWVFTVCESTRLGGAVFKGLMQPIYICSTPIYLYIVQPNLLSKFQLLACIYDQCGRKFWFWSAGISKAIPSDFSFLKISYMYISMISKLRLKLQFVIFLLIKCPRFLEDVVFTTTQSRPWWDVSSKQFAQINQCVCKCKCILFLTKILLILKHL